MNDYYIISDKTMLLYRDFDNNRTVIYDENDVFLVNKKLITLIRLSINNYKFNFIKRDMIKKITNSNDKLPVVIDVFKEVILFPTHSPRNKDCVWVNYNNIKKIQKVKNNVTCIYFKNGKIFLINRSIYSIKNQISKCVIINNFLYSYKNKIKDFSVLINSI